MAMKPATKFEDILNQPLDEITPPKLIPAGHYHFVVRKWETGKAGTGTDMCIFHTTPIAATDDVDKEALADALTKGNGEKISLADRPIRLTFFVTEDAKYRLKRFLNSDCKLKGRNLLDLCNASVGAEFIGFVKHTPNQSGDMQYANIVQTSPVE